MGGTESSRKAELDKREQELDERKQKLDEREQKLYKRVEELDKRVEELDKRAKELDKSAMRAGAVSSVQHNSQELEIRNDEPTCRRLLLLLTIWTVTGAGGWISLGYRSPLWTALLL